MSKRIFKYAIIGFVILISYLGYYFSTNIKIKHIELVSPDNSALKEDINIKLNKKASVYIEYWKKNNPSKIFRSQTSKNKMEHNIHLVLLEPNTTYQYQVIVDMFFNKKTKTHAFKTRKQSPWLVHNWIKQDAPHDANALGNGLLMLCYRGFPGYIAMVDGNGTVRWYWQDKHKGVRLANLTPRNTIIALLAPANKDEFKHVDNDKNIGASSYYLRTGKLGFLGGTEIVEIDLEGNVLWRNQVEHKDLIIHHDVKMNSKNQVLGIFRDYKMYDLKQTGVAKDTLWGDGVIVMDTLGQVLKKWSAWDVWDIAKDKNIEKYSGDRFHFNSLAFDHKENYILSSPIENQIWNIDSNTGEIKWKLGKNGDFKIPSKSTFYFQHDAHFNSNHHLMLFDNGDFSPNDTTKTNKRSRSLSFKLDTVSMTANLVLDVKLPFRYFTGRMGATHLMPNNNILHTSSKTGGIVITNQEGEILWVLNTYFIPYRAEYIPTSIWKNYFQIIKD